jgi:hypothetical protein
VTLSRPLGEAGDVVCCKWHHRPTTVTPRRRQNTPGGLRGQLRPRLGVQGAGRQVLPAAVIRSRHILERGKMSTDDSPEKLHEDGTVETPEWHRARAKRLRQNGFTKMAEQHEQLAQ